MNKEIINIGIPSKGRLKNDTLKIFVKKNLKIHSERGERDLFGYIKNFRYKNNLCSCKRLYRSTFYWKY